MRSLAVVVACVSCVGVANGTTWDATEDWSIEQNPNGPWSYGYQVTLDDPFILYDFPDLLGERLKWWHSFSLADCCPGLGMVEEGGYDTYVPEGKLMMHPGPGPDGGPLESNGIKGEYSILRWTTPADGLYDISALFEGLNYATCCDLPDTVDVHVLVNGEAEFSGDVIGYIGGAPSIVDEDGNVLGPKGEAPIQFWRQILSLTAGDLVDFAVGDGINDSYQVDATGVTVTISTWEGPLLGDFNIDNTVDAADYVVWRDTGGTPEQYNEWRANFGLSLPPAAAAAVVAVPEPTTSLLVVVLGVALAAYGVRFR